MKVTYTLAILRKTIQEMLAFRVLSGKIVVYRNTLTSGALVLSKVIENMPFYMTMPHAFCSTCLSFC